MERRFACASKSVFVALLSTVLLSVGCENEYLPVIEEDSGRDSVVIDSIQPDEGNDPDTARDTNPADQGPQEHRYQILVQNDTSKPLEQTVGRSVELSAIVVDYMAGKPASGITVAFKITSIEDAQGNQVEGDASLETAGQGSDGSGRVSNDFFVGIKPELTYTITLSLPDFPEAETADIKVKVLAFECGSLRVSFTYDGVITSGLRDIEVFVVPSTYQCGTNIRPGTKVSEENIVAQRTASNIYSQVTFDCLPAGTFYTVFANAKGAQGECTVAGGCSRTLVIMPDTTDELILEFSESVFQTAGRYNAVDHFNFEPLIEMCAGGDTSIITCVTGATEDVGKTVCCAIKEIVKFFKTPENTIVELVFDALGLWLGSAIIDTIENVIGGPLKALLGSLIDQWMAGSPWLSKFDTIGGDITQIITNLELESELVLKKKGSDYLVEGTHYWHAVNLYWRLNCVAEGQPGYDPECGKFSLDTKDIQNLPENFPLDLLEGGFTADVMNFDRLSLRQHEIALSYGKLVLWAINDIVIPGISGDQAHSIEELARLWLDCAGLAAGQVGDLVEQYGSALGLDRSDVENACNSVVNTMIAPVDGIIGKLSLATTLVLTGAGRMIDEDCDSNVDKIVDGTYIGYIQSAASSQASITGDWEAVRIVPE